MENNISDVITPSLSSPTNKLVSEVSNKSVWFYIKIIFAVLFLALMGLNVFTYLSEGTDIFGNI